MVGIWVRVAVLFIHVLFLLKVRYVGVTFSLSEKVRGAPIHDPIPTYTDKHGT
jgi:hypothetical protein